MKSSTQDSAEGKIHRVKGKIKEIVGKAIKKPDLEAEGKEESRTGKVKEKIGDVKKVAKWPTRVEQLSILSGQISSLAGTLAGQIVSAGGTLAGQISQRADDLEKAGGEADSAA